MHSNTWPIPSLLSLLLALSLGQTCRGQDPIVSNSTESKYEAYYARVAKLFEWFDGLQLFPPNDVQLIWTRNPSNLEMGTTEPKFGVVVAQSENTIRFKTLDLWDRSIYLPTREEQQGPLLFEASAEISVAEAIFVFRRYYEKQPRHQFHDNQNSIAPMMLESFVLAYLADRAGDQQRSRQIMQLLIQRNLAHGLTRERLSDAVAVRFLQQFTLDFSDLELSWADQLRLLQNFDSRLPEHAYKARVDRMLVALGSIAAEEVGHQAKWKAIETGQSELSPADQIRELVWQLRNQSGKPMGSFSFGDPLNDTREELSPGGRLIATGYAAVPELIEAIDNRSFTRSATQYSPDPLGNVFTVGEVAVFVLSDIAKRDFHQHLQPTAMFAEPEGLAIAKQEILQWWRDFEEHGELGLLTKRIRTAEGFEVLDIAKLLVEKYPDKALAILSPELARLDGDTCPWVLELIAAEPKREMEPLLRDLMNRQELSIRAAAAGALLRLGHQQVISQLITTYRELSASPKLYEKYTSWSFRDANGVNNLVSFLSECNRVEAIQALADSLSNVQPELAETVLHRVIAAFGKNASEWERAVPPASPAVRQAVIQLYLDALGDQRRRPSTSFEIGPDGQQRPHLEERICDIAARYLANLLNPQVKIDYQLDEAGKVQFNRQIEKRVRAELLPPK